MEGKGVVNFRDLDVYKKAYSASLEIHSKLNNFPTEEKYGLVSQLKRSSRSICANIAEGFVKQRSSKNEFKRFLMISIGSCAETLVWIDYCYDLKLIDISTYEVWAQDYETIAKMLNSFHSRVL
jgi:four helix bundle protein